MLCPAISCEFLLENPIVDRRQLLSGLAGLGIGTSVFQRAVVAQAEESGEITPEMVSEASGLRGSS